MPRKKRVVHRPPAPPRRPSALLDSLFPAVARWVRSYGWIEIGDQEGFGFIVRALDYGGLIFEDRKVRTFAGALAALERAITSHLNTSDRG
jgi:hypothetical protein